MEKEYWLTDLIKAYQSFGGVAPYSDIYIKAEEIRKNRGASWTAQAKASIRRTVEDHSRDSKNFRGKEVFYSVNGLGNGVWGLMPEYQIGGASNDTSDDLDIFVDPLAYVEGLEGISREYVYLKKSRDPKLVEARKIKDNFTCQACLYRKDLGGGRFVIDVHHLSPLGSISGVVINSIDDLLCLCPNCHRIAHSRKSNPLTLSEIKSVVSV